MPGEEEWPLLQAMPDPASRSVLMQKDKAINSKEGPSHFLWLLDHMCCIKANPITPGAWLSTEAFLGECSNSIQTSLCVRFQPKVRFI